MIGCRQTRHTKKRFLKTIIGDGSTRLVLYGFDVWYLHCLIQMRREEEYSSIWRSSRKFEGRVDLGGVGMQLELYFLNIADFSRRLYHSFEMMTWNSNHSLLSRSRPTHEERKVQKVVLDAVKVDVCIYNMHIVRGTV